MNEVERLRERIAELEAALELASAERRREWLRAENAEGERDTLRTAHVGALQDIDDLKAQLEQGQSGWARSIAGLHILEAERDEARAQRDKLLAALRELFASENSGDMLRRIVARKMARLLVAEQEKSGQAGPER